MSEWISVKDRLPTDDFIGYGYGRVEICAPKRYTVNPACEGMIYFAKWGGRAVSITHWMPLPAPPKE